MEDPEVPIEESEVRSIQVRIAQIARVFRPGAPMDTKDLFAGRTAQMNSLIQSVVEPFMHAIVFGERGVGKTSLVTVVGASIPHIVKLFGIDDGLQVVRENCAESDTFSSIWRRAISTCPLAAVSRGVGFGATANIEFTSGSALLPQSDFGPGEVLQVLRSAKVPLVFVFDEFDRVHDKSVANPMADLLKSITDHHIRATVVIVGVGDNVTEIMAAHGSIERCTRQIHMPRMVDEELQEILEKGEKACDIQFDERTKTLIVRLARGFPHYIHLLASEAMKIAVYRREASVSPDHLASSLDVALNRSMRSLSDSFIQATQSPRRDALHKEILLSCAMTSTDAQGYFRPSDLNLIVAHILKRTRVSTNAFVAHLTEFSSLERGTILKRVGKPRSYRYRFSNPLMIPYVLVRGLQIGLITVDDLLPAGPNEALSGN
jgi:Cdc6-like AAA superfamily ATPase